MKDSLFSDFPPISSKEWRNKIQMDLRGEDYSSLLTYLNGGLTIKPFYQTEGVDQLHIPDRASNFRICNTIFINNLEQAIGHAINDINSGADCLKFIAIQKFDIEYFHIKLHTICSEKLIELYFELHFLDEQFYSRLISSKTCKKVFLNVDIIGNLSKTGNWYKNKTSDHQKLDYILKKYGDATSIIGVNVSIYQNSGANCVQEVAYALAHANEYLVHYGEKTGNTINFNFSVGGSYFVEIAKLRAFRYLWKLIVDQYNFSVEANIFTEPSRRNKSVYDFNNNMIRTTTECMSAIIGGSDVINNLAYDAIYHKRNEFGERIARNQLLIMQNESSLKNDSMVKGTYLIEELTMDIAKRALEIFKSIEKSGGFVNQLFKGTIQMKIAENAKKEMQQFNDGSSVLVGVNKYGNDKERMKNEIELYPFLKKNKKQTIVVPITERRLAEAIEMERLKRESE